MARGAAKQQSSWCGQTDIPCLGHAHIHAHIHGFVLLGHAAAQTSSALLQTCAWAWPGPGMPGLGTLSLQRTWIGCSEPVPQCDAWHIGVTPTFAPLRDMVLQAGRLTVLAPPHPFSYRCPYWNYLQVQKDHGSQILKNQPNGKV